MDFKDLKKAGVSNADDISIKEIEIKDKKNKLEIDLEEIRIKRREERKKKINNIKKFIKNFWSLLWKDDSFKGWVFSVVFIFLFIKFLFFPFMSLVTGTALPLAIVESCSMYHDGGMFSDVDSWWESQESKYASFDISLEEFENFPMKKGFTKGDILFIVGADSNNLNVGDVVIFDASQRNPVIHRIVGIREENEERIFSTIGDNNMQQLPFENSVTRDQIVGRAVVQMVPYAGWMKLLMYEWKRPVSERGFCS